MPNYILVILFENVSMYLTTGEEQKPKTKNDRVRTQSRDEDVQRVWVWPPLGTRLLGGP